MRNDGFNKFLYFLFILIVIGGREGVGRVSYVELYLFFASVGFRGRVEERISGELFFFGVRSWGSF